jgi:hypothetical protein
MRMRRSSTLAGVLAMGLVAAIVPAEAAVVGPIGPISGYPPVRAAVGGCGDTGIAVSLIHEGVAGGNVGVDIEFTNTTTATTCTLSGYPTAEFGTDNGISLWASQTLNGYIGGVFTATPPTVTLAPGQSASAIVEWSDMPPSGQTCPTVSTGLQITPPGNSVTTVLNNVGGPCQGFQVHPVVPGTSGSYSG